MGGLEKKKKNSRILRPRSNSQPIPSWFVEETTPMLKRLEEFPLEGRGRKKVIILVMRPLFFFFFCTYPTLPSELGFRCGS